jgi:hypothetical protein
MTKRKMETSSRMIGSDNRGLYTGKEEIAQEVELRVKLLKKINQAMKIGKKKGE